MSFDPSDIVFVLGVVGWLLGAYAQDCMKRRVRALGGPRESRGLNIARCYARVRGQADISLAAWPLALFYIGYASGAVCSIGAVLMIFVT